MVNTKYFYTILVVLTILHHFDAGLIGGGVACQGDNCGGTCHGNNCGGGGGCHGNECGKRFMSRKSHQNQSLIKKKRFKFLRSNNSDEHHHHHHGGDWNNHGGPGRPGWGGFENGGFENGGFGNGGFGNDGGITVTDPATRIKTVMTFNKFIYLCIYTHYCLLFICMVFFIDLLS